MFSGIRDKAGSFGKTFRGSVIFGRKGTIVWGSYDMVLIEILILPLMQMSFFAFLGVYLNYPTAQIQYIVVGNAIQSMSFSSVFAVANITSQDKFQGTLPNLMASPSNRFALFTGRAFFEIGMSAAISAAGLFYAVVLYHVDLSGANMPALVGAILLTSITMMGFGLLISSIGLYMRTSMIVANVFLFLGMLVSGVNFPVSVLPTWLQAVSYSIPLTYGVQAVRESIVSSSGVGITLLHEAIVGLIILISGYLIMLLFERMARKYGKFESY